MLSKKKKKKKRACFTASLFGVWLNSQNHKRGSNIYAMHNDDSKRNPSKVIRSFQRSEGCVQSRSATREFRWQTTE